MRGGLRSSSSVPGAGIVTNEDPYCDAGHKLGPRLELIGVVGVACTEPQNSPAWNCWSGLMIEASTSVSLPAGPLAQLPPAHGTGPATRPLSYLQLKPSHGPRFQGWYCRWVVMLNFSSWSMRKTPLGANGAAPAPPICGVKKRADTLEKTMSAENPCRLGTLTRPA